MRFRSSMSKHVITTIRYDGPALADHQMDVQELAPALLALAEMVQLANKKFNGDAATMKVLVRADIEQRCFQLDIHIVQSILESAKHLFSTENYKTAKEIAELLDLLAAPVGAIGGGVFWFWKRTAAAKDSPPIALVTEQHGGQTTLVQAADGANVTVNNTTYLLASDPAMIELGKKVLKPLARPGYQTLGFYRGGEPSIVWDEEEAREFISKPSAHLLPVAPVEDDPYNRTPIRAVVSVKTQRNEGRAQWEIKWANRAEWASMDDIDWLERFQRGLVHVDIPYWLDVDLEMTTSKIDPDAAPSFAIKKVHTVINGGGKQGELLGD